LKAIRENPRGDGQERFVNEAFAALTQENKVKFHIDGESYFAGVAEGIKRAQKEIFI